MPVARTVAGRYRLVDDRHAALCDDPVEALRSLSATRLSIWTSITPDVRFNDISGNAHAGLRLASNQTSVIDATCNYWGSATGPSGVRAGDGDALVVDDGAAVPLFMPFAMEPIAASGTTTC